MGTTTIVMYRWRVFDEVRGRYLTTRHRETESEIKKAHPEATPVAGTREERIVDDDALSNSTSSFLRGVSDFGCGHTPETKKPPEGG